MSDTTAVPKPSDIARFLAKASGVNLETGEETPTPQPAPTPAPTPTVEAPPAGDTGTKPKAPWNDTDNPYDAERAAQLIENLRAENKRLRGERDTMTQNVQPDRVTQLETEVTQLREQLLTAGKAAALAAANLPADLASFITANSEDGIKEQVQKLASLRGEAVPNTITGAGVPGFAEPALHNPPDTDQSLGAKLMRQLGG